MALHKDRITLPPVSAQRTNLTCHFCIVGCGYHVYKWPETSEGGRAPNRNALGLDFRKQLPPRAAVMTTAGGEAGSYCGARLPAPAPGTMAARTATLRASPGGRSRVTGPAITEVRVPVR